MESVPSLRYFLLLSSALYAAAAVFSGFSFNPSPCFRGQPPIIFRGQLPVPISLDGVAKGGDRLRKIDGAGFLKRREQGPSAISAAWRKPPAPAALKSEKPVTAFAAAPAVFDRKKDSTVIIHPMLPYELQLYFKDRQSVHLELMFSVVSSGGRKFIIVKRKISSGNLDADLLCSRYLGHYLFIQQSRFALNSWQTVRIDLSK